MLLKRAYSIVVICGWAACSSPLQSAQSPESNIVLKWDNAALQGVRDSKLAAPAVARTLAIVHTCIYDAWAAYDSTAIGTLLRGTLRRPAPERISANKEKAISYAAYRALVDLMPVDKDAVYLPAMKKLGYDPADTSTDIDSPIGIGNVACAAVLEFRHHDGANQLGDLAQGAYSDWTGYTAVNAPTYIQPPRGPVANPSRWQPLVYFDATGGLVSQQFAAVQWGKVIAFALPRGDEFRWLMWLCGPAAYGSPAYRRQAEELVTISAGLTDRQKMIAEYWSDGPHSEQPPGHWAWLAQLSQLG